ncbi:DUF4136 domain-containing protein [Flavobacterium sp.]|uniref:DUF4136 domain-containing protein n=1 Tax=Flavobacterium sp. TaxID=239 RepID=UPI00286B6107|nr:DUF4136 domain-containing protein [Flavobacterium sp.]
MKTIKLLPLLLLYLVVSCGSVHVNTDYDKAVDFTQYKTYAYYKTGIDKVEISDLDKKRILRSIDEAMLAKGFTKTDTPDLLININAKSEKNVNMNQFYAGYGYGWGFGWSPYWGGGTSLTTSTDGILTIDLIDAKKKELIWQGEGSGYLTKDTNEKDENIKEFVTKILAQYPPDVKK